MLFGTPASFLRGKVKGTYGVADAEVDILPNIIDIEPGEVVKSEKPTVVFLARLDPYKRPWLFVELARRFPHVEFIFMGKSHFQGKGAWEHSAATLPCNVRMMGHVQGQEKIQILSQAWVLINTSRRASSKFSRGTKMRNPNSQQRQSRKCGGKIWHLCWTLGR